MSIRTLTLCFVFALPLAGRAEAPPAEHLLPASTQVYLRWDGVAAHREQYRQVTIGRLLESDLAPLLKSLLDLVPKTLQGEFVDQKLLGGAPPDKLMKHHADITRAGRFPELLAKHGIVVAGEIGPMPSLWSMALGAVKQASGKNEGPNPLIPTIRATVIVPDAATDVAVIESFLRLMLVNSGGELAEEKIANRRVMHAKFGELHAALWDEFGHVILALGTESPAAMVDRTITQTDRLASNPFYQRIGAFKEFRTDVRGFVDLKALMKTGRQALNLASLFAGGIGKEINAFGADSFEGLVYYCGFDGATRREVAELDLASERNGVAKLLGGTPLRWDEMPPLPADVGKWSAHRLSVADTYSLVTKLRDIVNPPESPDDDSTAAAIDKFLGLALKEELLDQLSDMAVIWSSPSEGAVMLGQTVAIRVRDAQRVEAALDQIVQSYAPIAKLKKRACLDATIREIQVQNRPGFIIVPSYVVFKNWLVVSLYPQPLQAFVFRAAGQSKPWEPDSATQEQFAKLPKSCSTWAFNDPRSGAQQILSFAPIFIEAAQSFTQTAVIEVGTLPSGSSIIQKLTPNVTGVSDDGRRLRWDTRGGMLLLGDSLGIDPLMLFIAAQILN